MSRPVAVAVQALLCGVFLALHLRSVFIVVAVLGAFLALDLIINKGSE